MISVTYLRITVYSKFSSVGRGLGEMLFVDHYARYVFSLYLDAISSKSLRTRAARPYAESAVRE